MRGKIVRIELSVAAVICALSCSGSTTQEGVLMNQNQMTLACQHARESEEWTATLRHPEQGGFGWRCYSPSDPDVGYLDVDVEGWCWYTYKLHARGGSTAYNWRCDS